MTDPAAEAAFQAALDAHPDDHTTRAVFADYLEECGDPRAEGYRALGMLRVRTDRWATDMMKPPGEGFHFYWSEDYRERIWPTCRLPCDWFLLLPVPARKGSYTHYNNLTRAECENAAALAFSLLPPARRAELLAQPVTV